MVSMFVPCRFVMFLVMTTFMIIKESDDGGVKRKEIKSVEEMKQLGSISRLLCCMG